MGPHGDGGVAAAGMDVAGSADVDSVGNMCKRARASQRLRSSEPCGRPVRVWSILQLPECHLLVALAELRAVRRSTNRTGRPICRARSILPVVSQRCERDGHSYQRFHDELPGHPRAP